MNAPLPRVSWLRRTVAKPFHRALDRIDEALVTGQIDAFLPDGTFRVLGGRAPGPACSVVMRRWRALVRLGRSGSVGWYEGWAAGDWTSPDPIPLFDLFMRNRTTLKQAARAKGVSRLIKRTRHALRRNDRAGARRNIVAHYDLGNAFYASWLDATMSYSSALWHAGDTIEQAQCRKQDAILARLDLSPGSTLLEIGCGWGSLAAAAAGRGATVTAISLSPSQLRYAREHHPGVDFCQCDYRDMEGQFDAVASVEMVEAVGERYWSDYLRSVARCLKPGGRAAIQFILIADDVFEDYRLSADFIQAYVFPGGMLLSASRFRKLAQGAGLRWENEVRFGPDYAETLRQWRLGFDAAVLPSGFDAQFVDLWRYYLMYCEGGFRGGGIDVAQVTLVKG